MFIQNGKLYDATKWVALVGLPAVGTLYVALSAVWDLSNVQAVSGTILAVDTFLGGLLHLSSSAYKSSDAAHDGTMDVTDNNGTQTFSLSLNGDPADLLNKKAVSFKVNAPAATIPVQPTTDPAINPNGL